MFQPSTTLHLVNKRLHSNHRLQQVGTLFSIKHLGSQDPPSESHCFKVLPANQQICKLEGILSCLIRENAAFVGVAHRSDLPLLQGAGAGIGVISVGTGHLRLLTQHDDRT